MKAIKIKDQPIDGKDRYEVLTDEGFTRFVRIDTTITDQAEIATAIQTEIDNLSASQAADVLDVTAIVAAAAAAKANP